MTSMDRPPDLVVQSVAFQEGVLQINYMESRETNNHVSIGRSLIVDQTKVKTEVDEVLDTLRDIVDKALLMLRNPPETVRRTVGGPSASPAEDDAGAVG